LKPSPADKVAADRAAVRAAGGDPAAVDAEAPRLLDPALLPAGAKPALDDKPKRRYGPPPTYPGPFANEQALLDAVFECAYERHSLYATCAIIGVPYSTLRQWAAADYGARLSECLEVCADVRRGMQEKLMNENLDNKDFNTPLFKFMMAVQHKDYRLDSGVAQKPPAALPSDGAPEQVLPSDFELGRRLASYLDRHAAIKRGEIIALPSSAAKEG
jgi:hypothetical protein